MFGSGDCPTYGYVVPNLRIRTKRRVHDGRKVQSPWDRSAEQCAQRRWRAVATALSGRPHEFLRSNILAWNARGIAGTVAATNRRSPLRFCRSRRSQRSRVIGVTMSGYALNVRQRLGQVRTQIFDIFHTNRETNETVVDPKLDTLFRRNRSVSHQRRMFDQAFHSTETFGQRK
jgi:hypothetical protein